MASHASFTVGLIADDLTGANDAAVQFARRGWRTLLVLGSHPLTNIVRGSDPCLSLVALTTDSRALDVDAAAKATARAVERLLDAEVDRIYLKIDSTMRGSVPGQIAGALSAWRSVESSAVAAICPAYPSMGRTVIANRVLVDGKSVELTPAGSDPMTPVRTGDLGSLIPASVHMKTVEYPLPTFSMMTFDASTDQDLAALAGAIDTAHRSAIPVGSAGLANAMAAAWSAGRQQPNRDERDMPRLPPDPRILIQVTSLNPVSLKQVARLSSAFPEVCVLAGQADEVSNALNDRVRSNQWDVVGLIGGDGARAAVARLGASAIRIVDSVVEGVPLGVVVGGHADRMPVFTKSGGFGADDALVRIVERLRT